MVESLVAELMAGTAGAWEEAILSLFFWGLASSAVGFDFIDLMELMEPTEGLELKDGTYWRDLSEFMDFMLLASRLRMFLFDEMLSSLLMA